MQTVGSLLSGCLEDKNGVFVIPNDGLDQLVTEMFPHCKKEEIQPGVYRIRIPLKKTSPGVSHDEVTLMGSLLRPVIFVEVDIETVDNLRNQFLVSFGVRE
ncbi:UNVERIFIED_CONTAM: hypothetical protein K2H54_022058 [Gekko kuhli]